MSPFLGRLQKPPAADRIALAGPRALLPRSWNRASCQRTHDGRWAIPRSSPGPPGLGDSAVFHPDCVHAGPIPQDRDLRNRWKSNHRKPDPRLKKTDCASAQTIPSRFALYAPATGPGFDTIVVTGGL